MIRIHLRVGCTNGIAALSVLDIEQENIHCYATIGLELKKNGRPVPGGNLWVAALCRQHSLPLLSRDRHFNLIPGLPRLGW